MIRSLFSISVLFVCILLIGRATQWSNAEDVNSKSETRKNSTGGASPFQDLLVPEPPRSLYKGDANFEVRARNSNSPAPGVMASPTSDQKGCAKEDNAGTDEVPFRDDALLGEQGDQEMPDPADVPKSAEATDDTSETADSAVAKTAPPANKMEDERQVAPIEPLELSPVQRPNRSAQLRELPLRDPLPSNPGAKKPALPRATNGSVDPQVPAVPMTVIPSSPTHPTKVTNNPPIEPSPKPKDPNEPLSAEMQRLRGRLRSTIQTYFHEKITNIEYSPWGIMHALIAFGVDTEIYCGDGRTNAIGWLCYNGPGRGMQMLYVDHGKLRVRQGPGYQGHAGQFLAMLAQCRVKKDFPIRVDGYEFTVADLIESEMETCRTKTELTFKLIGLAHYLDIDATWKNDLGEDWDLTRLIREELAQPIVGAACGGTHRMTGLSYAVNKRTRSGREFDGQWLRAKKFVDAYHDYIFRLQNPDGSFSTKWFAGREDWGDIDRRLQTTGHMLEWLVYSCPKEQLDDPRVLKAVNYLNDLMVEGARVQKKWEIGTRGHAIHALAIYNERRFGDKAGHRDEVLAKLPIRQASAFLPEKPTK